MRFAGRITDWNDDKGFGFVLPNGGGDRAFVHVNDFQHGSRRPRDGDLVSYKVGQDARGRSKAFEVRHAGQRVQVRKAPSRLPRMAMGTGALAAVAAATFLDAIPLVLGAWYGGASAVSYVAYLLDKQAAGRGARRTPEGTLHLFDLLGGWPGGLVAQQQFRHKTVKQPFQLLFWFTVGVNLAGAWWWLDATGHG